MANITPDMGVGGFAALAKSYGDSAAQTIIQTGEVIQKGLQRMQTNRQLQAMGAELSNLNPQSPDWSQQAVALGARYPLAMQSEAGQFLLGTQAKAHAEWTNTQQMMQREEGMFKRQVGLENLQNENRMRLEQMRGTNKRAGMVDLSNFNPNAPMGRNPAAGVDFFAPTDESLPQSQGEAAGQNESLYGMDEPDLVGAAIGPLKQAFEATGEEPLIPPSQFIAAVGAERSRRQQIKMQEDRQRQSEKMAADRDIAAEERTDKKLEEARKEAAATEARTLRSIELSRLKTEHSANEKDISQHRAALTALEQEIAVTPEKKRTQALGKKLAEFQKRLEDAGKERVRLESEMKALTEKEGIKRYRWNVEGSALAVP